MGKFMALTISFIFNFTPYNKFTVVGLPLEEQYFSIDKKKTKK
jgi:hypothetical protein